MTDEAPACTVTMAAKKKAVDSTQARTVKARSEAVRSHLMAEASATPTLEPDTAELGFSGSWLDPAEAPAKLESRSVAPALDVRRWGRRRSCEVVALRSAAQVLDRADSAVHSHDPGSANLLPAEECLSEADSHVQVSAAPVSDQASQTSARAFDRRVDMGLFN